MRDFTNVMDILLNFWNTSKKPAKYLGGDLFRTVALTRTSPKFMTFISSSNYS